MNRKLLILTLACLASPALSVAQNARKADAQKASADQPTEKTMKAYMVADAHLDTQWNWDVQATIGKHIKKTLDQNLFLLKRYPNYVFNFEGAVKYSWMKEYYPMQFEQVKNYVRQGRWNIAGSSWDANETVICSPESWIRNILLGQTFYREEFGKEGNDVFLPDCFGFGYDLPTLAAHCGLVGFSSQKLQWRAHPFYEGKKYPYTIGLWKGIDGSQIMMVHGFDYAQRYRDVDLSNDPRLIREIEASPLNMVYRYYGTGDTGGSPDLPSVRSVMKGMKGDGPVKIYSARSNQIYNHFLPFSSHPELPVFDGELTMDVHGNGCYTSQAAMKLYNRQNEHLGDAAERSAVIADWIGAISYPLQEMTDNWRRVIWHQFHDDVTGTCIPRAYEFSWNDELISMGRFSEIIRTSVGALAREMDTNVSGTPIIIYNNETFQGRGVADITLADMTKNYVVSNQYGRKVASQVVEDSHGRRHLLFDASVPSTGVAIYSVKPSGKAILPKPSTSTSIENSVYRVSLDAKGNIASIFDKRNQKELVDNGQAIGLVVFEDCESYEWPAWEILKKNLDKEPVVPDQDVRISLVENGSLRKSLRIEKRYGDSEFVQFVRLYEGSQADRIDICNEVEWRSPDALLKMNFPLGVSNGQATYDLGLGSIERGNNVETAFEVYSHEWTDLTDRSGDYGVTILNDSKYGWDKPNDNTLRLSLLYSPKVSRNYTYQARQDYGHHEFTISLIGHKGALDKAEAVERSTMLNSPLKVFVSDKHKGSRGREFSFVACDNANVTVRALKKAEDGGDEFILRVYENSGRDQHAKLTFAGDISLIEEVDGTEKPRTRLHQIGKEIEIDINGFGVRSYRLMMPRKHPDIPEVYQFDLPFNRRCFSYNGFRNAANFEGGYSYAAELVPAVGGLRVDNVGFKFGEMDGLNGVACQGQTISLPQGSYNRLYLLAASAKDDREATFTVGGKSVELGVPYYTGFIGQWGHDGQTTGYLKQAEVAYVGTHRHSATQDEPYEFTYMFKLGLDIPQGATEVTLPDDENIVVFAATAIAEAPLLEPVSQFYRTNNRDDNPKKTAENRQNLLGEARVIGCSGEVNEREKAQNLIDGNAETKWCDAGDAPYFVDLDLGEVKAVSGWKLLNAGVESADMITRTCLLQVKETAEGEWQTADMVDGNRSNEFTRTFESRKARYVRLFIVSPVQGNSHDAARVYEMELY